MKLSLNIKPSHWGIKFAGFYFCESIFIVFPKLLATLILLQIFESEPSRKEVCYNTISQRVIIILSRGVIYASDCNPWKLKNGKTSVQRVKKNTGRRSNKDCNELNLRNEPRLQFQKDSLFCSFADEDFVLN